MKLHALQKIDTGDMYSYGIALLMAVVLHAVIVVVMTYNWGDAEINHLDAQPYYIEASIVSENPYTAEERRAIDREKTAREKRIQKRRLTEKQLAAEQAAWEKAQAEKRRREAETSRLPPTPEPVEEVAEEPAPQPSVAPDFASDLAMMLEREANARKAVTDDEKALAFVAQIQREIIQNWSRPPSARNGMQALLRVHLIPTGEVVDVKLEDSSGNDAFDRSAISAVRKADRFIVPGETRLFEKNFREFTVLFRPDDLRL